MGSGLGEERGAPGSFADLTLLLGDRGWKGQHRLCTAARYRDGAAGTTTGRASPQAPSPRAFAFASPASPVG